MRTATSLTYRETVRILPLYFLEFKTEVNFFWILDCRTPRKTKITSGPIDDQPDLALQTVVEEEPKPDAVKITAILNVVNVTDAALPTEVEVLVSQSAPAAPEAKAKRALAKTFFPPTA